MNKSNIVLLPRRVTPCDSVNSRGLGASGLSPVAFLKRSELTQTFIDCLAVVFALAFFVITSLGTVVALGILLFYATY